MRWVLVTNAKRAVVWLVALLVVVASVGLVWWDSMTHSPRDEAVETAESETTVTIVDRGGSYVIRDGKSPSARTALVFYPGANVAPESYVSVFAPLVEQSGVRVYIPKMPLHLALLDTDRAASLQSRAEGIDEWYVGGHSLGGAMACRYASNHPDGVAGVVLFGSYCRASISEQNLSVLQVAGTRDGLVTPKKVDANENKLPADATVVTIDGANHSQFGSYTGQRGDRAAEIEYDRAHSELRETLRLWLADTSPFVQPPRSNGLGSGG